MKLKTVSATYERKFNLGDYNSLALGVTLWADLDETDAPSQALADLQDMARERVRSEYGRLAAARAPAPVNGGT